MPENIGRKVNHARQLRDISINKLARLVGVSPTSILQLEKGEIKSPKSDFVMEVARALNVDVAYLMDDALETPFDIFNSTGQKMPDEIKDFLMSQDLLPWVELIKDLKLKDLTPEECRAIVEAVQQLQQNLKK